MNDSNKIDLIIQYALLVAGEEDDYLSRQLGPIHLIKYVYLADLEYARLNNGRTYTGIKWIFYTYGPWSEAVYLRLRPATNAINANEQVFESAYDDKKDWIRWQKLDDYLLQQKEQGLPNLIATKIKRLVHKFTNNTPLLLNHTYKTTPMLIAAPTEYLDFTTAVSQKNELTPNLNTQELTHKQKKVLKSAMKAINDKFHKNKTKKMSLVPPVITPRYDEIYEEGLEYLDSLAGEQFSEKELNVKFMSDIWKSSTRNNNDVS